MSDVTNAAQRRRTRGESRQRLRRFVTLGMLDSWEELPNGWRIVTAASETVLLSDARLWAYLDGYGQGWWAAQRREESVTR